MKKNYIVWVGGVVDYEGSDFRKAYQAYMEWLSLGYDDVILEDF